ncbi:hypothetical protein BDZ45DRAFT_732851 [Acephala macrosclerotiorum]|nr:hypothetical protein BDZ45DRAFT_732851 [Acephala macrosclerotiorum]
MSHTPNELVRAITEFTKPNSYYNNLVDDDAWDGVTMAHWGRRYYALLKTPDTMPLPEEWWVLDTYFRLFDRFFFFGSLQNHCMIALENSLVTDGDDFLGMCVDYADPDQPLIRKLIYIQNLTTRRSDRLGLPLMPLEARHKSYAETILHEMVHAYLWIFSCRCSVDCVRRAQALANIWQADGAIPPEEDVDIASWGLNYAEVKFWFGHFKQIADMKMRSALLARAFGGFALFKTASEPRTSMSRPRLFSRPVE